MLIAKELGAISASTASDGRNYRELLGITGNQSGEYRNCFVQKGGIRGLLRRERGKTGKVRVVVRDLNSNWEIGSGINVKLEKK